MNTNKSDTLTVWAKTGENRLIFSHHPIFQYVHNAERWSTSEGEIAAVAVRSKSGVDSKSYDLARKHVAEFSTFCCQSLVPTQINFFFRSLLHAKYEWETEEKLFHSTHIWVCRRTITSTNDGTIFLLLFIIPHHAYGTWCDGNSLSFNSVCVGESARLCENVKFGPSVKRNKFSISSFPTFSLLLALSSSHFRFNLRLTLFLRNRFESFSQSFDVWYDFKKDWISF